MSTFKRGHLVSGGGLIFKMHRDKTCVECHDPFVSSTASQKTCGTVCSEAREKRLEKRAATRERVNRNLSVMPKPKRGRPPKTLLVERKPPARSQNPTEAKRKCQ